MRGVGSVIDLGPRGGSGVDLSPGILHLRSNNGSSSMSIILSVLSGIMMLKNEMSAYNNETHSWSSIEILLHYLDRHLAGTVNQNGLKFSS